MASPEKKEDATPVRVTQFGGAIGVGKNIE